MERIFRKISILRKKVKVWFGKQPQVQSTNSSIYSDFNQAREMLTGERESFLKNLGQLKGESYERELRSLLSCDNDEPIIPADDPTLKPGDLLGRYQIIRFVGRGAMGEVYQVSHPELGIRALKILSKELSDDAALIERFRREAIAASALNHQNIMTIHDFDRQGHLHYIVSEFVEGEPLRELIGKISIEQTVDYARQIAKALDAAHRSGIVHRDIKPENVMVRPDQLVKVLDFGLAKPFNIEDRPGWTKALSHEGGMRTDPQMRMGTLPYMSPEQLEGEDASAQSDIWSWGVVFYEMLAGRRPFDASSPDEIEKAIREREPGPPSRRKRLNQIVQTALRKEPDSRYRGMSDALDHLDRATHPRDFLRWVILLAIVTLAGVIAYVSGRPALSMLQRTARLTTSGDVSHVALSPDGLYVAYSTQQRGGQILRIRKRGTASDIEIDRTSTGSYRSVTYSKDGKFIYYVLQDQQGSRLFQALSQGGSSSYLVADHIDSAISFSPDGRRFVFRRIGANNQPSLVLRNVQDGHEVEVGRFSPEEYLFPSPAWSSDGRRILCGVSVNSASGPTVKVLSVEVAGGRTEVTPAEPWYWIGRPLWMADPGDIIAPVTTIFSNHQQLVRFSRAGGGYQVVTHDPADYPEFDVSADSKTMVAIIADRSSSVWVTPIPQGTSYKVPSTAGRYYGILWTRAGKLISQTDIDGHPDLFSIAPETGEQQRLTHDDYVEQDPATDGRHLVYASNNGGWFHLWRADLDGQNAVPLTSGSRDEEPTISPDGQWVVYTAAYENTKVLRSIRMEGGKAEELTSRASRRATFSPDGSRIVASYNEPGHSNWSTAILDFPSGELKQTFFDIPARDGDPPVRWSADGRSLLYVLTSPEGVSNIWKQPIDGGLPLQLTHFTEDRIFAFSPSPDGKFLACVRGSRTADVFLMQQAGADKENLRSTE